MSGTNAFRIDARDGSARAGVLVCAHGEVETPAFVPLATSATVKGLDSAEVEGLGFQMVLGNTFHLFLQPGHELIASLGGLHEFMAWGRPIITDSGGFQVFSMGHGSVAEEIKGSRTNERQSRILGGHLAIVGDVKEVAIFLKQSQLPLVDSQPLAKYDHPITLSARDRLVSKLGDPLLEKKLHFNNTTKLKGGWAAGGSVRSRYSRKTRPLPATKFGPQQTAHEIFEADILVIMITDRELFTR